MCKRDTVRIVFFIVRFNIYINDDFKSAIRALLRDSKNYARSFLKIAQRDIRVFLQLFC